MYPVYSNDIETAVKRIKILGNGFSLVQVGNRKFVQSIPYELSTDHMTIMLAAQETAYVSASQLVAQGWSMDRIQIVVVRV
jgi:ESCRT-II complex subunit VPS22